MAYFLGSLNELEEQLGEGFIRTHRAYLVAADKIEAVDLKHNKLWAGGRECLLSRSGKAKLRRKAEGNQLGLFRSIQEILMFIREI